MDLILLIEAAAIFAAALALIVILRVIVPQGAEGPNLFAVETDLGWPQGIQEEEPIRWRVELVSTLGSGGIQAPARARRTSLVRRAEQGA
jgi:hypothetical protein